MNTLDQALGEPGLRPLPETAAALLRRVGAPPRLGAHLRAVHDVAVQVVDWVGNEVGMEFGIDRDAVLFGAATHDFGKVRFPAELSGPGAEHEPAGQELLVALGVEPRLARFAAVHGRWDRDGATLEELLVTLADKIWKGRREHGLEEQVAQVIAAERGEPVWSVFMRLDDELTRIAEGADARLAFQNRFMI
ncbi:HD domain-containing protein [Dactylosporangium sp. CS-047395]|uniref:HD domain-containing protein n=1 Tax=Dactylosporangium sp. CS-047395 TaxID=3239936 RepID=UPI003D8C4E36